MTTKLLFVHAGVFFNHMQFNCFAPGTSTMRKPHRWTWFRWKVGERLFGIGFVGGV